MSTVASVFHHVAASSSLLFTAQYATVDEVAVLSVSPPFLLLRCSHPASASGQRWPLLVVGGD